MPVPNRYKIEIEIFEGNGGELKKEAGEIVCPDFVREGICAWMYRGDGERSYRVGQKFRYPEDKDRICHWLLDSLNGVLDALSIGETLNWDYKGTPYEKVIDPEGMTTEYVRCIDPTDSGIVVKVIRTKITESE